MSATESSPATESVPRTGTMALLTLVLGLAELALHAIRLATACGIALALGGGLCLALVLAGQNLSQTVRTHRQARLAAIKGLTREAAPSQSTRSARSIQALRSR